MKKIIVIAGATGNLGGQIARQLIAHDVEVRAVVRASSDADKCKALAALGIRVFKVNMLDTNALADVFKGASCVVSALSGLREVIIDAQKLLLDAAVWASVPRFIPSDYCLDFRGFSDGENRNLDWRRTFHTYLDQQPIAATTIFNGAFMDMLTNEIPMILFKQKWVMHWGDADHKMGFTTIADIAAFTANAALDDSTPRYLCIAGEEISPKEIRNVVNEVTGEKFRLIRAGGLGLFSFMIRMTRFFAAGENDLYPPWQGMQYMRNMIDARINLSAADNNRYPSVRWTKVKDVLMKHLKDPSV
jgi:uncharacterized protein YbjT (DUF2867 family)